MANLTPLSFAQVNQNAIESYNANAQKPANTGTNSSLGPVFKANALEFTGLEWQILYLNAISRLQTCTNIADAASYVQPFGITPGAAEASQGTVTFSTNSPAPNQLSIPPGVIVATADGTQFQVIADATQPGWNGTAYVIAQGGSSVNATVQAVLAGSSGNVLAQTINQITSSLANPSPAGVSNVINNAAFTNGADAETVPALIKRFQDFISSRWSTDDAIVSAVTSVQTGLTYTVGDGVDGQGNAQDNFITVLVNVAGQSAGPSSSLISSVRTSVLNNRACGMPFQVIGPTLVTVSGTVTLQLIPGADAATVTSAAQTAFANYVNGIGLGNNIVFADGVSAASTKASYNAVVALLLAVPGVAAIPDPPGLTLNGGTVDIVAPWASQLSAGSLVVYTQ